MRVLLAGASGTIGRRLVPLLLDAGHEVTGITRRAGTLVGTGIDEIVADVLDRDALLGAIGSRKFDAVINELTSMPKTPTRHSSMRATNRLRSEGTSTLISVAHQVGAHRFVTASMFLGYGLTDHGEELVTESATFGELTGDRVDALYSALVSNEQQVRAFGGVVLRYGLFYGTGAAAFVPSDWTGTLPFIHVEDAAIATVLALEKGKAGVVYNVVDDSPASWRDVHRAEALSVGAREPLPLPSWLIRIAAPYAALLVASTSIRVSAATAKRDLQWTPRYPSYHDGLRAAVRIGDLGST
jgi:nucleoside-diphosphate-sugar epimerase